MTHNKYVMDEFSEIDYVTDVLPTKNIEVNDSDDLFEQAISLNDFDEDNHHVNCSIPQEVEPVTKKTYNEINKQPKSMFKPTLRNRNDVKKRNLTGTGSFKPLKYKFKRGEVPGYNIIVDEPNIEQTTSYFKTKNTLSLETLPITVKCDEIKLHNHKQVRWECKSCHKKGVMWVKSKSDFSKCPECGKKDVLFVELIDQNGECDSKKVWGLFNSSKKNPKKPIKSKIVCPECGERNYYLLIPPKRCENCRHYL